MLLPGLEFFADADDEDGFMIPDERILAFLRRELRVHILQLLGGDEGHAPLQQGQRIQLRVYSLHRTLRVANGGDDIHDCELKIVKIPVFGQDDLLPVPLIDIDGVEIVQLILIAADGVHVGIEALARPEAVAFEREALPLGKGLHDLSLCVGMQDVKGYRTLVAVQIVIQARILGHKQRCRDAVEIQLRAEIVRKQPLQETDGLLCVIDRQQTFVPIGDGGVHEIASVENGTGTAQLTGSAAP